MRTYILMLLVGISIFKLQGQDSTKYKISVGIGYSKAYLLEAKKNELGLDFLAPYIDRNGKYYFDYSDNIQLGFYRKLLANLFVGLQYNFIAGRFSTLNGASYKYNEYPFLGIDVGVKPKYISYYTAHVLNVAVQYRFNIKLNVQNKIYIQPSLGYGLGIMSKLNQTGIEYATRDFFDPISGLVYKVTDRYQTNTDIKKALTSGFNSALEIGYSFKQFDFGISYNINKLQFSKTSRDGTISKRALSQNLNWVMLSIGYRF